MNANRQSGFKLYPAKPNMIPALYRAMLRTDVRRLSVCLSFWDVQVSICTKKQII